MATQRKNPPATGDSGSAQGDESVKFEDQLAELEAIVARIESGERALEESIADFERGVGLLRALNRRLDEAERRVEALTRGPDGALISEPVDDEDENPD
jgi:exodeoxyribonuclease VII small subunit